MSSVTATTTPDTTSTIADLESEIEFSTWVVEEDRWYGAGEGEQPWKSYPDHATAQRFCDLANEAEQIDYRNGTTTTPYTYEVRSWKPGTTEEAGWSFDGAV